ncbi:MAG: hypothetical protein GXO69_09115 [Acidobacteria bacterium]|nr:hypothetical protein [Acidobacteriota bacterium]
MWKRLLLLFAVLTAGTTFLLAGSRVDVQKRLQSLRVMLQKVRAEEVISDLSNRFPVKNVFSVSGGPASVFSLKDSKNLLYAKGGLVVGDDSPDESVTLTGNVTINGDIVVANQGTLLLDHANVILTGNINVVDNGSFTIRGGSLTVLSQYVYSNGIIGLNDSSVTFQDTVIDTNGYNWNGSFSDNATFVVQNTVFHDGLTTGLFGTASANVDASNPLEWVVGGNASLSVANDAGPFIFWPIFPNGSVGDLTFPDGSDVSAFSIADSDPKISGIGFSITLSNIRNVWWGMLLNPGCNVTVRDSVMRTTGIMADSGTDMNLSGLVNGQTYADSLIPVSGLTYHLIHTSVETWNVYPWGIDSMTVKNCVIGELGASENTVTTVNNCLIDGSGGYVFSDAESNTTFLFSSLLCPAVAHGNSVQLYVFSSILNGDIVATDNSTILLANTVNERRPQAEKGGIVIEASVAPPTSASVGTILPLTGSANTIAGPELPVDTEYWQIFYGVGSAPDQWFPVTGPQYREVRNNVLGLWDTTGLAPGLYTLKLSILLTGGGDPLDITRTIALGAASPGSPAAVFLPHIDWSDQWQSFLTADNTGSTPANVFLYLYGDSGMVENREFTVPAGSQQVVPLVQGECGIVETHGAGLLFRETFVNVADNGIAEFPLNGNAGKSLVFLLPHYAAESLSWMGLAVMNPGAAPANATLTAVDETGFVLGQTTLQLAARSRTANILEGFFDGIDRNRVARVTVSSDQPLAGINISGVGNEKLLFTPAVAGDFVTGTLILPHIANQWSTWENRIIADNTGDTPETLTLTLYSGGTEVLAGHAVNISAGHTLVINLNDYAGLNPDFGLIQNPSSKVALRQSYRAVQQGGMAEFILTDTASENLNFTFPAGFSDRLNWMGLAVANPGNDTATATATAWKDGIAVATVPLSLPAHVRIADILSALFDNIGNLGADRVVIDSDTPLSGLNISGMDQERLLFTPARE